MIKNKIKYLLSKKGKDIFLFIYIYMGDWIIYI